MQCLRSGRSPSRGRSTSPIPARLNRPTGVVRAGDVRPRRRKVMESVARGGTRWKRFAVVMVPSVAATAAIGVALSQGALAASFSVSGQQFKVTADRLDGTGFVQYGAIDSGYTLDGKKTAHPVAVSAFKSASIK